MDLLIDVITCIVLIVAGALVFGLLMWGCTKVVRSECDQVDEIVEVGVCSKSAYCVVKLKSGGWNYNTFPHVGQSVCTKSHLEFGVE